MKQPTCAFLRWAAQVAFLVSPTVVLAIPELQTPWDNGQWWRPSTYEFHAGLGTYNAVDFNWRDGNDLGLPIRAAHSGTATAFDQGGSDYGKYVIVVSDEDPTFRTLYAHFNSFPAGRFAGSTWSVARYDLIGTCGSTGNSSGPHLHLEFRINNVRQDVRNFQLSGQSISFDANLNGPPIEGRPINTPPTIIFEGLPDPGWYRTNQQLNWRVTAGSGTVSVTEHGPSGATAGPYTTTAGFVNSEMIKYVRGNYFARATNAHGVSETAFWNGGFDDLPPTVTRASGPAPGQWLKPPQTVSYSCSDPHAGFKHSQYGFGNVSTGNWSTDNPRSVPLPTTSGDHVLLVGAADLARTSQTDPQDNYGVTDLGTFRIDGTLPTVGQTSFSPPSGVGGPTVTVQVNASDQHSGVNRIEVRVNGTLIGTVNGGAGQVTWTTAGYPENNSVEVRAIDQVGNEVIQTYAYQLDLSPPDFTTVTDEGAATSVPHTLSFAINAEDNQSGISEVEYKLGTGPGMDDLRGVTTLFSAHASIVVGNLALPQGQSAYLSARVKNGAGVWSSWVTSDGIVFDLTLQPERFASAIAAASSLGELHSGTMGEPIAFGTSAGFWSLSRTVSLEVEPDFGPYLGSVESIPVEVEVYRDSELVEICTLFVKATGKLHLDTDVTGEVTIFAKPSHWLRKNLGIVTINELDVMELTGIFVNGDIDGDNEIGPGDFAALALAFLTAVGDPNFNPDADLDGDGEVGPGDFAIIAENFLLSGD